MGAQHKQHTGFTIVELLIVIVVIAILAAITLVAYNGVTTRARLSGALSYASQLKDQNLADAAGYWDFNECSGNSITNSGGNAASTSNVISGALSWSTDTPTGTGCSLSFNGSTTTINTGVVLTNTYYNKSAWIKTTSPASAQNIISDFTSGTNNTAFYLSNGQLSSGHNTSWASVTSGNTLLNDGKWHFVSVTFTQNSNGTSGTMSLTVDGATVSTNSAVALMASPTQSDQAIGSFGGGSYFNGLIDDPMIVTH